LLRKVLLTNYIIQINKRVLYEMTTGKELKAPFPDDLEYKDFDSDIGDILKLIFKKKKYYKSNYL